MRKRSRAQEKKVSSVYCPMWSHFHKSSEEEKCSIINYPRKYYENKCHPSSRGIQILNVIKPEIKTPWYIDLTG